MKKNITIILFLIINLFNVIPSIGDITIRSSINELPMVQSCSNELMKKDKSVHISVQGGETNFNIISVIDESCNIAISNREANNEEIKLARLNGKKLVPHVIAKDGIAVIVHPLNKLSGLTINDLKNIYTGKNSCCWISSDKEITKMIIVTRNESSNEFELFNQLIVNNKKLKLNTEVKWMWSDNDVIDTVATNPEAIGYVSFNNINYRVRSIKINGVQPSKSTIMSGEYPLSVPLLIYTNGPAGGETFQFIEFMWSDEGQKIIKNKHVGIKEI